MRAATFGLAGLCFALAVGPLQAQPLTRADLVQALADRDRRIGELERRLAELERQRAAPATEAPPITTLPAPTGTPATASGGGDEEAELAALSRTLVQRGGLVLLPVLRV